MKTKITFIVLMIAMSSGLIAQNYVSTDPQNKNAIIEEFTGVRCVYCPQGHTIVHQILETYPGQAFVVGYHPSNSSFCVPNNSSDPDFRRDYPNAFFNTSYCGTNPFMPGAFVNRKKWSNNERLRSRGSWLSHTSQIIQEASPLNVGLSSTYDIFADVITITVELYFTETVNNNLTLYVVMSENGLIAAQTGGTTNYEHFHVFREAFTAQWGDPINNTSQGTYLTYEFDFDNATTGYNLLSCELMAFVYNTANETVISGIGAEVGENTYVEPEANFTGESTTIAIGESVQFEDESEFVPTGWAWTFEGGDPETSNEENPVVTYNQAGLFDVTLIVSNPAGSDTIIKEEYIEVYDPVGINETGADDIRIYPNPTSGILNISTIAAEIESIALYTITGNLVADYYENIKNTIDLSAFTEGIYFLHIKTSDRENVRKVVLKK